MIETRRPVVTEDPAVLAYVAYWRVLAPLALDWESLSDKEQAAWRAASQAVRRGALREVRRLPRPPQEHTP